VTGGLITVRDDPAFSVQSLVGSIGSGTGGGVDLPVGRAQPDEHSAKDASVLADNGGQL